MIIQHHKILVKLSHQLLSLVIIQLIIEFVTTLPEELRRHVHVEFAQPIGETRGFTMEVVDMAAEQRGWATDHPFTLVTADNGINSVRLPACQPATLPNQRVAVRTTSSGSSAPMARNGRRNAST